MLKTMSNDVFVIAQAVVILLELVTFSLMIAVVYLAFVSRALYRPGHIGLRGSRASRVVTFATVSAITLAVTHVLLQTRWLLPAVIWFVVAVAASFAVYWTRVRSINRAEDMRVPYTIMVLGGTCLLTFGALVMLWATGDRIHLDSGSKLSINTLTQIAAIAVAAISGVFTYIMKSDQSNRTAKQQIYQTLELQSIELFRFEASNRKLVKALWYAPAPSSEEIDRYELKQYVCQMLNLFEMAYRFRVDGIMAPSIFGSWVIWIWELSNTPVFQALWADKSDGLPLNYVPDFRRAIDLAIHEATRSGVHTDDERRNAFFRKLADDIECDEVEGWLRRHPARTRKSSDLLHAPA